MSDFDELMTVLWSGTSTTYAFNSTSGGLVGIVTVNASAPAGECYGTVVAHCAAPTTDPCADDAGTD